MTMQVHEPADLEIDGHELAEMVEFIAATGDFSRLSDEQRGQAVLSMCKALRLNPLAKPFDFLRLTGKLTMYANRGCTDQLAAIHRINRKLIRGPEETTVLGVKMVIAVVEASMPNGRVEQSTATCIASDPCGAANVLMKVETKAKRRATLAITGLSILDEMEVATVVEGDEMRRLARQEEQPKTLPAPPPSKVPTDLEVFRSRFAGLVCREDAAQLWVDWRDRLRAIEGADITGWGDLAGLFAERGWKAEPHARGWLKRASQEIVDRASQKPDNDPPSGGGKRPVPVAPTESAADREAYFEARGEEIRGEHASVTTLPHVPEWAATAGGIRAHLASLDHVRHLENSARLHGRSLGAAYVEPAAERLIALDGPDAHGSHLATSTARGIVGAWAAAGPRPKAETRRAGGTR